MDELITCKYCQARTPADNFNCIYCGNAIFEDSGFMGKLKSGKSRIYLLLLVIVLIIVLVTWFIYIKDKGLI